VSIQYAYLHSLNGRLRIKIAEVKNSPETALEVEQRLVTVVGVDQVSANPVTGNVLIFYDPAQVDRADLLDALHSWGYLRQPKPGTVVHGTGGDQWGSIVFRATTEFALQKLITALI